MNFFAKSITALSLSLLFAHGYAADIALKDGDFGKLVGSWVGEREWRPTGSKEGAGRYERLNLEIKNNQKSIIIPVKKPNKKIKGPVKIKDGKVLMKFMKEQRIFTYSEEGGKSMLTTTFQHKGDGKPYNNTLVFTK